MEPDPGRVSNSRAKVKRACDQCQFRKMKCDGNQPCQRCPRMGFECSFQNSRRPKDSKGRRVQLLKGHQSHGPYHNGSRDLEPHAYGLESPSAEFNPARANVVSPGQLQPSIDTQSDTANGLDQPSNCDPFSPDYVRFGPDTSSPVQSNGRIRRPRADLQRSVSNFDNNVARDRSERVSQPVERSFLPGVIQETSDASPSTQVTTSGTWPSQYTDYEILQWLDIFFDRLYCTLPIANRASIYRELMLGRHHADAEFGAMILSICAVSLVQPVYMRERASMKSREEHAKEMLNSAAKLRSSFDFGEHPSIEATVTSFLMFAALFGMSMQKAAWLKLRESLEIGRLLGLHKPETYQNLSLEESSLRLRVFLILSVTERGYALQRNHYISFTGQTIRRMQDIHTHLRNATTTEQSGVLIYDDRNATATLGLLQLMKLFDSVDEVVIPCWNKSCSPSLQSCAKLTASRVRKVYEAVTAATQPTPPDRAGLPYSLERILSPQSPLANNSQPPNQPADGVSASAPAPAPAAAGAALHLSDPQTADIFILQQWLLTRLWVSCVTHDLLDESSAEPFMRPSHAIAVANRVLAECARLGETVLEIHGLGMIERIYDVAMGVVMAMQHYAMSPHPARNSGSDLAGGGGGENQNGTGAGTNDGRGGVGGAEEVLAGYFGLLGRLRGGRHPFSEALREAVESLR